MGEFVRDVFLEQVSAKARGRLLSSIYAQAGLAWNPALSCLHAVDTFTSALHDVELKLITFMARSCRCAGKLTVFCLAAQVRPIATPLPMP